jgi:hypothetical protein
MKKLEIQGFIGKHNGRKDVGRSRGGCEKY